MINPLSISTKGRITSSAKRTLTLAVIGWLVISYTPPTPPSSGDGGGGSNYYNAPYQNHYRELEREDEIRKEDEDILLIIKIWVEQCQ